MPNKSLQVVPYIPGDLTEEKNRLASHYELAKNRFNEQLQCERDQLPQSPPNIKFGENIKNSNEMDDLNCEHKKTTTKTIFSPFLNVISNFSLAKKLQRENLEHNPLPDTITDSIYRKLHLENHKNLSLENNNGVASAIGWKGYPGYGPSKCTKLKVFRPKTCSYNSQNIIKEEERPYSASNSFEHKWRFIRQNKVRPMDLAICWDLTSADPSDEPKPPTHIDGSNGSQAPAVFSLIHPSKSSTDDGIYVEKRNESVPIFDYLSKDNQETNFLIGMSQECSSRRSNFDENVKARAKSALDLHDIRKRKTEGQYKSTPNLSNVPKERKTIQCKNHTCKKLGRHLCVACELKNLPGEQNAKSEYKMAFKAGVVVPQKNYNVSNHNCKINVPKQKNPYKLLDYEIHSLASPFSLQNYKRNDYPEHWRLTTVYQHSYKPVQLRKRNLLHTVYK